MKNNLKLLFLSKDFDVNQIIENTYYTVRFKNSNLMVAINPKENKMDYVVIAEDTVYADEFIKIDIEDLNKLQDKDKRVQKLKEFVANIYNIDINDDEEDYDDFYY